MSTELLARNIAESVINQISGRNKQYVLDNPPSGGDVFVGQLSPILLDNHGIPIQGNADNQLLAKFFPTQMGFTFRYNFKNIKKSNLIKIKISFFIYYRVVPTYIQQFNINLRKEDAISSDDIEDFVVEDTLDGVKYNGFRNVFKKSRPIIIEEEFDETELINYNENNHLINIEDLMNIRINTEIENLISELRSDPYIWKKITKQEQKIFLSNNLKKESNEFDILITTSFLNKQIIVPDIKVKVNLVNLHLSKSKILTLTINNINRLSRKEKYDYEKSIFDVSLRIISVSENIAKTPLKYFDEIYVRNPFIYGRGINCTISENSSSKFIATEHTPIHEQHRYNPITDEKLVSFKILSDEVESIVTLTKLQQKLEKYYKQRLKEYTETKYQNIKQYIEDFDRLLNRYNDGLELIKENQEVKRSFNLLNQTMEMSNSYPSWHFFQIVFIVGVIPDLVAPSGKIHVNECNRDLIELIWFPTGGGKTETYLGSLVFQLFYDRFVGKKEGVSVLLRFPMRILSLQQIQRIHKVLYYAEELRSKENEINDTQAFTLAYFAGSNSTPNQIMNREINFLDEKFLDENMRESMTIIDECLKCNHRGTIEVVPDIKTIRLKLVCSNCGHALNVYTTDEEIYRFLPSVIVSTIDKIASATWRREFRNVMGGTTLKCPIHGFGTNKGCWYKTRYEIPSKYKCNEPLENYKKIDGYFLGVTLLIQDELHLLRDQLGAFASHYEGMFHTLIEEISLKTINKKITPKVIAATATIESYKDHIYQLYLRKTSPFPSRLPIKGTENTFFSEKLNDIGRLIIGVKPRGKTMIFSIQNTIEEYDQIFQTLWNNSDEKDKLRQYLLLLSYNQRIVDADQLSHSMETMVNKHMNKLDFKEINHESLTGDSSFKKIKSVLAEVSSLENANLSMKPRLINATSLISVGVDISGLNTIIFRGMPKNNAEYIQALSRGGRNKTGIIFTIYDHTRERDISHYTYFHDFHKYIEYLIEPIPVSRWAKHGIERTMPGIIAFTIYGLLETLINFDKHLGNYIDLHTVKNLNSALARRFISEEEILSYILKSYLRGLDNENEKIKQFVTDTFNRVFNEIMKAKVNSYLAGAISSGKSNETNVAMNSLRDIEQQAKVILWENDDVLKSISISSMKK